MSEHIGEWHTVVVTEIPADEDGPAELDYDIEHPASCPKYEEEGKGPDNSWHDPWNCDMAAELNMSGYEGFDITEPGTYRARFRLSCDYFGEWDGEVEVESVVAA